MASTGLSTIDYRGETAMKNQHFRNISLSVISLLTLLMPMTISAQTLQTQSGPPPVAAPLVREGDLAVRLGSGLGISTGEDEVEAENRLADAGISPRNGWIADYPATPDIIGELQQAVGAAADAGKVSLSRDEALKRLDDTLNSSNLTMMPYTPTRGAEPSPPSAENYPDPAAVNDYYNNEDPPIVTYYTPPPNFYYLYGWIPSPFWWSGFWFPGFYVLHDFHRTMIINRRPVFISNHFRDVSAHRVFRIDAAARFQGRTFGGIGAVRSGGFIPTGVPRSERRIFNSPPGNVPRSFSASPRSGMAAPRAARIAPSYGGTAHVSPPSRGGMSNPAPQGRTTSSPSRGGSGSGGRGGGGHR